MDLIASLCHSHTHKLSVQRMSYAPWGHAPFDVVLLAPDLTEEQFMEALAGIEGGVPVPLSQIDDEIASESEVAKAKVKLILSLHKIQPTELPEVNRESIEQAVISAMAARHMIQ
jgi:hypothetical protein